MSTSHELGVVLVIWVRAVSAAHSVSDRGTVPASLMFVSWSLCSVFWTYYRGTEYVFVEGNNGFVLFLEQFFYAESIFSMLFMLTFFYAYRDHKEN